MAYLFDHNLSRRSTYLLGLLKFYSALSYSVAEVCNFFLREGVLEDIHVICRHCYCELHVNKQLFA